VITKHRAPLSLAASALAIAVAIAACASSSQTTPAVPSGAPIPTTTSIVGLHLPIESYMLTPIQSVERDWDASVIVSACMHRHGFVYPIGRRATPGSTAVDAYTALFRRYGVTEAQSVRIWGYHVPGDAAEAGSDATKHVLPTNELRVLTGTDPASGAAIGSYNGRPVPAGGCLGEPDRVIAGGDNLQGPGSSAGGIVATIKSESFTQSLTDPRVMAVFARWSACMRTDDYHVANPLDAANIPSMGDPRPTATEIAKAEADVACKARTDLVGVWYAVESDYENAAIRANTTQLHQVKSACDAEAADIARLFAE